jgi:PAS domain S-box-containing protein
LPKLLKEAAFCLGEGDQAIARLIDLSCQTLGASGGAVFAPGPDGVAEFVAGRQSRLLQERCAEVLASRAAPAPRSPGPVRAALIQRGHEFLGVFGALLPGEIDYDLWTAVTGAMIPMFSAALRQRAAELSRQETSQLATRGSRQLQAVYDIGMAMETASLPDLLDMITRKATEVMGGQACSLLVREPDASAFTITSAYGLEEQVIAETKISIGQGICGYVAATGKPLLLHDLQDDPLFRDKPISHVPGVTSSIIMPLKDEPGGVHGVLCIRRADDAPKFTTDDMRLFGIFARHASLAINNGRLYQRLTSKLQELSTLSALTETITSTLDIEQVLNQVADNIVGVVKFDRCRIYLCDLETGRFSAQIIRGFPGLDDTRMEGNIGQGEGLIGMVAQSQAPLLVDDVESTLPAARRYARALGLESFYAQPIVARGRCIGVVVVSTLSAEKTIPASQIELLSTFVHQAGIAIENARFYAGQERRYEELATLYDVSRTLAAASGVQKAAQTVNQLATKITDSDSGVLLFFEANSDALKALHWGGVSENLDRRLRAIITPLPVPASARNLRVPRLLSADDCGELFGPAWQPIFEAFLARHRSVALVPLVVDNAAVGFLLLGKHRADYGVQELKLIAVASSQAATVLSSAAVYERRIGQHVLELSAVYELMQKIRTATTMDEALNSILDIVASIVWSDRSTLYTVDVGGTSMSLRAEQGAGARHLRMPATLSLSGDSIPAKAQRERRGLIAACEEDGITVRTQPRLPVADGATEPNVMRSCLALPLVAGDEIVGVLTLHSMRPDVYTEESVMMLHLVTSQAATIYREMSSFRILTRYTENILRSIAAGVITIDRDGIIATWNARAEEIIKLNHTQAVGLHYRTLIEMLKVEESVREETVRMVEFTAQTGKVFTRNRLCYRTPQGDETYVNLSASQLKSEAGEYLGVVVVFEDITHEIQMQEEVERVSKLAETGQLAANIAHELRNPLSSIKGAAQLLRHELPEDYVEQHGEFLDIIVEEVNGLNRITSEFLEFSRVTPPQMEMIDINAMTSRLLQFMSTYLTNEEVQVVMRLDERIPKLYLDKSQIEQVIRNVVINAAQAMPHGGTLTVETRYNSGSDVAEIQLHDTGVGIQADKLEKIWTPFFTTKTKGTGLGLAIARKIVETHGGRMTATSTPGVGSYFTIQLPVAQLYTRHIPAGRQEIAEQRSDQPGGSFDWPRVESIR